MSIAESRVQDERAAYIALLQKGFDTVYEARPFNKPPANKLVRVSGPGTYIAIVILSGATTATAKVYDQDVSSTTQVDNESLKDFAQAIGPGSVGGTFVFAARRMRKGIAFTVDASDAIIVVVYR